MWRAPISMPSPRSQALRRRRLSTIAEATQLARRPTFRENPLQSGALRDDPSRTVRNLSHCPLRPQFPHLSRTLFPGADLMDRKTRRLRRIRIRSRRTKLIAGAVVAAVAVIVLAA